MCLTLSCIFVSSKYKPCSMFRMDAIAYSTSDQLKLPGWTFINKTLMFYIYQQYVKCQFESNSI